jgi:hypothetical protein
MRRYSKSTDVPSPYAVAQARRAAAISLPLSGTNGVFAVSFLADSSGAGTSVERLKRGGGCFAGLSD